MQVMEGHTLSPSAGYTLELHNGIVNSVFSQLHLQCV